MNQNVVVLSSEVDDEAWAAALLTERWGSSRVVSRGVAQDAAHLPGLIAVMDQMNVGLLTYRIDGDQCEIVTLDSLIENVGIGTALLEAVRSLALENGCRRVWLVTTNDNLHALRFYQRRGFQLVAVHAGSLDVSRRLKPEIPLLGRDGIPIRDEIELELPL